MAGKLDPRRAFEKLLAPVLYERLRPTSRHCPDTGVLAAYYSNALSPDETKEWELHFSTCLGCQAELASLARLEIEGAQTDGRSARRWSPDWQGSWKWAAPAALAASAVLALVVTLRNREVIDESTRRAVESKPPPATVAPRPTPVPTTEPTEVPPTRVPTRVPPAAAVSAPVARPALRSAMPLAADDFQRDARAGAASEPPNAARSPRKADGEAATAAVSPGSVLIGSGSDVRVVWRVGRAGAIDRSNDGGRSWTGQRSGVTEDLVAGSAPSSTVCWVVGGRGTVLRTTDGQRWERVIPPTTGDLLRVRASGAETATVISASGRRFVTNDGGQTWRSI